MSSLPFTLELRRDLEHRSAAVRAAVSARPVEIAGSIADQSGLGGGAVTSREAVQQALRVAFLHVGFQYECRPRIDGEPPPSTDDP
jgi:hypothetical protein